MTLHHQKKAGPIGKPATESADIQAARHVFAALLTAIKNYSLYPPEHIILAGHVQYGRMHMRIKPLSGRSFRAAAGRWRAKSVSGLRLELPFTPHADRRWAVIDGEGDHGV